MYCTAPGKSRHPARELFVEKIRRVDAYNKSRRIHWFLSLIAAVFVGTALVLGFFALIGAKR